MTRKVVGIGGTLRANSSSELLVRAVLNECEKLGAETRMFDGPTLATLPHYNPETPDRTDGQAEFVKAGREADALVISSPGYHGGVSGVDGWAGEALRLGAACQRDENGDDASGDAHAGLRW